MMRRCSWKQFSGWCLSTQMIMAQHQTKQDRAMDAFYRCNSNKLNNMNISCNLIHVTGQLQ